MGKLSALVVVASMSFGTMALLSGPQQSVNGSEATQSEQALSFQTREAARSGYAAALQAVAALPQLVPGGPQEVTGAYGPGATYTYTVQVGNDGAVGVVVEAGSEANGVRHRHVIQAALRHETAGGGGTAPVYTEYALFGDEKIAHTGEVRVQALGGGNANVRTNGSVHMNGRGSRIEGFLEYSGNPADLHVRNPDEWFYPKSNPSRGPVARAVPAVDAPPFDAAAWATKADEVHEGDLTLGGRSSTLRLGTRDEPKVIYVGGNFRVNGNLTVEGYGAIVVDGRTDILGSVWAASADTEIAFCSDDRVNVLGELNVNGHILGEVVRLDGRATTVTGSIVATATLENVAGRLTVNYRRLSSELGGVLFGGTVGLHTVAYRERPEQTREGAFVDAAAALGGLLATAERAAARAPGRSDGQ